MPGPVSDAYDCEWGTSENRQKIEDAIDAVYELISQQLGRPTPMFVLDLVCAENMGGAVQLTMTVQEWRIIRFALERAKESL